VLPVDPSPLNTTLHTRYHGQHCWRHVSSGAAAAVLLDRPVVCFFCSEPTPAPVPTPPPAPKKAAVLSVGDIKALVYTADGKRVAQREGALGDTLFKADKLGTGQSVEVRHTAAGAERGNFDGSSVTAVGRQQEQGVDQACYVTYAMVCNNTLSQLQVSCVPKVLASSSPPPEYTRR
jgi:hypothetical protein